MSADLKGRGGTVSFILITAFLNLAGVGVLQPVLPEIVSQYVSKDNAAFHVGMLASAFSLCQFLAVPTLGVLSDRFGRRPVLLVSLFGSAIGYLLFGIGGALWVLYLGRIIDGITGGNLATIYAYMADITTQQERTRFFGFLGSVSGFGYILGPAIGGILYKVTGTVSAPFYAAAALTLLNMLWGYFVMPESLAPEKRLPSIAPSRLNPFVQLGYVFHFLQIRLLLLGIFMWMFAFSMLQGNLNVLTKLRLDWNPDQVSLAYVWIGSINVAMQGLIVPRLLPRFGESRLAIAGITSQGIGMVMMAILAITGFWPMVFIGLFFTASGNGLATPSLTGLISHSVGPTEQGRVQGGSQAVQALARVLGPAWGGWSSERLGQSVPYFVGAGQIAVAVFTVVAATGSQRREHSESRGH